MNRLGKFVAFSIREKALFIEALLSLIAASAALRIAGLARMRRGAEDASPSNRTDVVASAVRMVESAACIGLHKNTCLEKSVALGWMLRRRGICSTLQIG